MQLELLDRVPLRDAKQEGVEAAEACLAKAEDVAGFDADGAGKFIVGWLRRYGLRWDLLVMRETGDYSAARHYKREVVDDLRTAGFDLRLAFEDDRRNVDMFHAAGVPCVYIHSGYYD